MAQDIEAGLIRIDGMTLPGALSQLRIRHEIIIDEIQIQDRDGHLKQPAGYQEAAVSLELVLQDPSGNPYALLGPIQSLFRQIEGQLKPQVHILTNMHANSRGISRVLFRSLETEETNQNDTLLARIELEEYIPLEVQVIQAVEAVNQQVTVENTLQKVIPNLGDGKNTPGKDTRRKKR